MPMMLDGEERRPKLERALCALWPDARLVAVERLHGGISADTYRLQWRTHEREGMVTARYPQGKDRERRRKAVIEEAALLDAVFSERLPVPKPLYVSDEGAHPFILLTYLDGKATAATDDPLSYARQMAEQLARIHSVDIANLAMLPEAQAEFGRPAREPNVELREDEVWEALTTCGKESRERDVLRHGDFWPGNLLWQDGRLTGIIDWEEACVGDPVADVAITQLDVLWAFDQEASESFTTEYLRHRPLDLRDLRHWQLRAALRPMTNLDEWASAYPSLERPDITFETMKRDLLWFIDRALSGR